MCENSELRHTILTSQELRCFRISRIKKFQNFWIVEIKLFLFINYVTRVRDIDIEYNTLECSLSQSCQILSLQKPA